VYSCTTMNCDFNEMKVYFLLLLHVFLPFVVCYGLHRFFFVIVRTISSKCVILTGSSDNRTDGSMSISYVGVYIDANVS